MMAVEILKHTLTITGFVFVMMLIIEYVNVMTRGKWQSQFANNRWRQYLLALFLGATPGCLGAFAVVAMYSHRVLGLGALVAAMIATSGDEAFVMLAMMPERALPLTGILILVGFVAGWLTDTFAGRGRNARGRACDELEIHPEVYCDCFPRREILQQWKSLSLARGVLAGILVLFLLFTSASAVEHSSWGWKPITILLTSAVGLFVVGTVPEHFLQEHLWGHIAKRHLVHIFLWTLAALTATCLITERFDLEGIIQDNLHLVLLIACLLGVIPESGPHLIFVTLFAKGVIPFSILLANSIVQDGHGMLPLLAHSRREFLLVKAINLLVGLTVGVVGYLAAR